MDGYDYEELDPSRKQIRVLRYIEPESHDLNDRQTSDRESAASDDDYSALPTREEFLTIQMSEAASGKSGAGAGGDGAKGKESAFDVTRLRSLIDSISRRHDASSAGSTRSDESLRL